MKLNFNNYRNQTIDQYNDIVDELNNKKPDLFLVKQSVSNLRKYMVFLTCLESELENFKSLDIKIKTIK